MDCLEVLLVSYPLYSPIRIHGISLSRPQNLKFWDSAPRRLARDRPGVASVALAKARDAGAKTGPEAVNVAVRGGESGRVPRASRKSRVPGGEGGRFPGAQHFLRKRSLAEHPLDGRKRHTTDSQN